MAEGGEIAKAWVSIIPSLDGGGKIIEKELGDAGEAGGKKAGKRGGEGLNKGMKSAFDKLGKLALTGGVAAGAALATGLAGAINMDGATRKMNASLGLTGADAEKAGKAAGTLYNSGFGESMEDATLATEAVISSIDGMRTASEVDLAAMAKAMGVVATVAEEDVSRAAQVAGQMITTGFAQNGVEAADMLTVALQQTPKALRGDLLDAIDEYGPAFSQLGISGDQAMSMLVDASAKGMYGIDKTGDAVKEFSLRMVETDKTASGALEAIGLNMGDLADDMAAGGERGNEAMSKVVEGLLGIKDPGAQAAAAIDLFGTPIEDLNTSDIPAFLESLNGAGGSLGEFGGAAVAAGDQINGGPGHAIKTLGRTIQGSLMTALNGLLPSITAAANYLSATLGPAIVNVGDWLANTAIPALVAFGGWFSDNLPVIQIFAAGLLAALLPVFLRMTVELAKQVIAWTLAGAGSVKAAALYVINSYKMVAAWVRMGAAAIVSGAQTAYVWLLYRLDAIKSAATMVASAARIVAQWVVMAAGATLNAVKMAAAWVTGVITGAARAIATMIVTAARYVAQWALMAVQSGLQALRMAAAWVVGVGVPAVAGAVTMAVQAARVVASWVLMGVQSLIQAARMAAAWLIAMGPIGWVIAAVIALVALIILNWEKVSKFTSELWTNIVNFIKKAWSNITGAVKTAGNAVKSFLSGIWNSVKNTTINVWNSIVGWIKGIPGKILSGLQALGRLGAKAGEWFGKVKTAAVDKFNDVVSWIRDVPNRILSALGNVGSLLANAGKQILQGFLDGLKQGFENVKNFVGGIGSWIADNKGPKAYDLALLVPAGGWIMDGLGSGIEDSMSGLKTTLGDVSWMIENGIDPQIETGVNARVSASVPATVGSASALAPVARAESEGASVPETQPVTVNVENMTVDSEDRAQEVAQELWVRGDRAKRSQGKINLGGVTV